jgi:hypothetical protein
LCDEIRIAYFLYLWRTFCFHLSYPAWMVVLFLPGIFKNVLIINRNFLRYVYLSDHK